MPGGRLRHWYSSKRGWFLGFLAKALVEGLALLLRLYGELGRPHELVFSPFIVQGVSQGLFANMVNPLALYKVLGLCGTSITCQFDVSIL